MNNDQSKGDLIYDNYQESVAQTELKLTRKKINMPVEDKIGVPTFKSFLSWDLVLEKREPFFWFF